MSFCRDVRDLFMENGFSLVKAEQNKNGDCRLTLLDIKGLTGEKYYVTISKDRPAPIEEFLNEYEEIHAFGVGIFHSCTQLKPLKYSEVGEDGLSPELADDVRNEYHYYLTAFWGLRVLVAIGALYFTGMFESVLMLFGW